MNVQAIIDDYVNKVAAKLPRAQRNDIGLELRTLLADQLRSAAEEAGRAPDADLAAKVLRDFGQPSEVAARYAPRGFQLIEPEQTPMIITVATICVAVQWLISLPLVFSGRMTPGQWWLQWCLTAFACFGVLVVWFGLANWMQRRFPILNGKRPWQHWIFWVPFPRDWRPGEPEATERRAAVNAAPIGAVLTVFFVAPAWLVGHLLSKGASVYWLAYADNFRHWLLPPLILVMVLRLVFFWAVLLDERRRAATEVVRFGLWGCFLALLYWAVFGWRIFAYPLTDLLFRTWLLFFLLINTIQFVVWIRRTATRVRIPKTEATAPLNSNC
jgi:hypothetical protein